MREVPRALGACALLVAILVATAGSALAHGLVVAEPTEPTTPAVPRDAIRLASHRVEAKVEGPLADVKVSQVFRNESDARLEATYLFPLPEGAAVSRFAMTIGGRLVEGEVMEASKARKIYESIVRRRRDPGLLEYVGRGLFRARVFPVEPRSEVRIELSFQQVLPDDAGTLEWRYPLATDRLHAAPVDEVVVTLEVESPVDLKAVYSPSHDLVVVRQGERAAQVSYEATQRRQDRDLLVYLGRSAEEVGLTILTHKAPAEDGTFLAVLAPRLARPDAPPVPKDLVFVLDTSGSMREHGKIDQAKRALEHGVALLRAEDHFGIVAFAAEVRSWRDGLVPATPEAKDAALRWIRDLRAEGGTYLEGGLAEGLRRAEVGRLALVVLLTDGLPTVGARDPERILATAAGANAAKARVFTFGVGYDLDVNLLDRIAEATNGARDYVQPQDEIEIVTSRFFRKVVEPALTDLEVDLGPSVSSVYPRRLPDLFAGSQVVVMGRYATPGPRTIRLCGRLGAVEVEHAYAVRFGDAEGAPFLPRLWAQRKVAFLLDEIRLQGETKELVDEVTSLAMRYAIVTPYTAALVAPELEDAVPASARPLFRGTGGGGAYRGPPGSVPPGLREPIDPTSPPPLPPSGPPTTPTPATPGVAGPPASTPPPAAAASGESKRLRDEKERAVERPSATVKVVAGRTFLWKDDGRWVESGLDEKRETTQVEFLSEEWTRLARSDDRLARILALGEKVVFLWEGKAYEVVPAAR